MEEATGTTRAGTPGKPVVRHSYLIDATLRATAAFLTATGFVLAATGVFVAPYYRLENAGSPTPGD